MKWTPERLAIAHKLYRAHSERLTPACLVAISREIGVAVTRAGVSQALRREVELDMMRAAIGGPANESDGSSDAGRGEDSASARGPTSGRSTEQQVGNLQDAGVVARPSSPPSDVQAERPAFNPPPALVEPPPARGRRGEAYLIISDTQEPYSAPGAIAFALAAAREFGIDPKEAGRVYHVGDEVDFYAWSRFPKSPEAPHTALEELERLRARMRLWYEAFPNVRVCRSNHGERMLRRAADAGLPSQVLRAHRDLLDAPAGWEWADSWRVPASKQPFLVEHGHFGSQAVNGARLRALGHGMSVVYGHQVSAQVIPIRTAAQSLWAMCVGALIDREAVAFSYGKPLAWQPCLGIGVVDDGGRLPVWVPYGSSWP